MDLIESGIIVNTHSIHGELKVVPWSDTVDFLCGFDSVYIDGKRFEVESARVHKTCILLKLAGIDSVSAAMEYRDKIIMVDRSVIDLPDGTYFIADLIGLEVCDVSGEKLGTLCDVLTLPANDVYVVRGLHEYMIPAVGEFIMSTDIGAGVMRVRTIPGMRVEKGGASDED